MTELRFSSEGWVTIAAAPERRLMLANGAPVLIVRETETPEAAATAFLPAGDATVLMPGVAFMVRTASEFDWPSCRLRLYPALRLRINPTDPAARMIAVTPNDDADLPIEVDALYIGVGGVVRVRNESGDDVAFDVMDGQILPISIKRVMATNTTATGIVGLA